MRRNESNAEQRYGADGFAAAHTERWADQRRVMHP
jgi:hypothetical protein